VSALRIAVVAAVALGGACDTPPMKVRYRLAADGAQSCGSDSCADIGLGCDAVLNIRILDPDDPSAPFLSICEAIPANRNRDLCAISAIDLADMPRELPKQTLEVQILIWPRELVEDPISGQLDCRKIAVQFDAIAGLPVSQDPAPAIGGRAFYQPGDEETAVTLGCTDLSTLNTCAPEATIPVAATVEDFDNPSVSVSASVGNRLNVDVGEPRGRLEGTETVYSLNPGDTVPLNFTTIGTVPAWSADVDIKFQNAACLQVLEDGPQATTAVTCRTLVPPVEGFDMVGYMLPKATLQQVLLALQLAAFPDRGLTVGIVLDAAYNRAEGKTITATTPTGTPATLKYLSADGTTVGGSMTTASGIFVSQDAPFGTEFGIAGVPGASLKLGGLIEGKVTIVFLQLPAGT